MAPRHDLVAIGTGTAASVAAYRCRAAGWRVAVIDHLPFGGTCALRGCDPKKVLVGVAETLDQDRRMRGKGIAGERPAIDWRELMAFKRSFTEPICRREEEFATNGIDAFHGRRRLASAGLPGETLEVWFARTLRDAFALEATDVYQPFREIASAALTSLLAERWLPRRSRGGCERARRLRRARPAP